MTKQDEQVARVIEDMPDSVGIGVSAGGAWIRRWVFKRKKKEHIMEWLPRPFISSPTWELEGIVLEWVQGQEKKFRGQFVAQLIQVWGERRGLLGGEYIPLNIFMEYKLGDRGRALLEVLGDG